MAVQIEDSINDEPVDTTGNSDSSDVASEEIGAAAVPTAATVDQNASGAERF
jgi:hypothetical protein